MIVLDAGGLIALDRDDRELLADIKAAALAGRPVLIPMGALAQAWRGGPRQARLSRAIVEHCDEASFDDEARSAGELCGKASTADVVDASVAIVAARRGVIALYTSDPDDMAHLLDTLNRHRPAVIAC